jgi:hypothetical protein
MNTAPRYCPGTLAEGFNTYSPACLRDLFNGRTVHHVLPYEPPQQSEEVAEEQGGGALFSPVSMGCRNFMYIFAE